MQDLTNQVLSAVDELKMASGLPAGAAGAGAAGAVQEVDRQELEEVRGWGFPGLWPEGLS